MSDTNSRRVALVTGASRGLGAVIARFLAGQGYALILTARTAAALDELAQTLAPFGGPVVALPGDIDDAGHRVRLAQAAAEFGRLDMLVNNACDLGPSPLLELSKFPLDKLARLFSVNVLAQLGLVQALLPLLRRSHGLVVNISSDAAKGGYETWGGYGATKAALDLMSLTLAHELRPDGIAVVSVDPGDMRTDMHQAAYPGQDISDRPLPDVTLPFWAWLFNQDWQAVSGQRFNAQAEEWLVEHEAR